jgi:hypothetical protein
MISRHPIGFASVALCKYRVNTRRFLENKTFAIWYRMRRGIIGRKSNSAFITINSSVYSSTFGFPPHNLSRGILTRETALFWNSKQETKLVITSHSLSVKNATTVINSKLETKTIWSPQFNFKYEIWRGRFLVITLLKTVNLQNMYYFLALNKRQNSWIRCFLFVCLRQQHETLKNVRPRRWQTLWR